MKQFYDLIVIGGGINGAALARLAAYNNKSVLVVEKEDFAAGASSGSSKMFHGGIRYLETFDFGLVRESSRERLKLGKTFPHLSKELEFLLPLVPEHQSSGLKLKLGTFLYQIMAFPSKTKSGATYSKALTKERIPGLSPKNPVKAISYFDSIMDDSRCTIENLLDAKKLGAEMRNRCEPLSVTPLKNNIFELEIFCTELLENKKITCSKIAVTAGAWSDLVTQKLFNNPQKYLLPSSGSHLFIVGLDCNQPLILPVPQSNRFFFVIPWRKGHIVGTTERPISYAMGGQSKASEEEIKELELNLKHYFPDSKWEVVSVTSAVRPLAGSKPSPMTEPDIESIDSQSNSTKVSRKHEFAEMRSGVVSGIGGKFTTHRIFAEELFQKLFPRVKCKSLKNRSFPGAKDFESHSKIESLLKKRGVPNEFIYRWSTTYGMLALEFTEVARLEERRPSSLEGWLDLELKYSQEFEWAKSSKDFIRRRSNLFFTKELSLFQSHIDSFFKKNSF